MGLRFRLHRKDLPGCPDIVFGPRKKVIFVHGCFWHRHSCSRGNAPTSRTKFWTTKLDANRERDKRAIHTLRSMKWRVLVVWECDLGNSGKLQKKLMKFLGE